MDADTKRRVDERLEELYRRHLHIGEGDVTKYYASGRGYYPPDQADGEQGLFGVCLVSADGEQDLFGVCLVSADGEQDLFGVCLVSADGDVHGAGDYALPFALQSISKVFPYAMALDDHGPGPVLERVGVKPSGDSFNSIEFDERNNRPHNPMVNAGALVTTDMGEARAPSRSSSASWERSVATPATTPSR